jgi:hypothetical protein
MDSRLTWGFGALAGGVLLALHARSRKKPRQPAVRYHRPPRFAADSAEARDYLRDEGYVVIKSALGAGQCCTALTKLWDWLEGLHSGIHRDDPLTWTNANWPPTIGQSGIIPWCGIGQSDAAWYVRSMPAVRAAFENVWSTPDLLVSFDGACVFRPWRVNADWKTSGSW